MRHDAGVILGTFALFLGGFVVLGLLSGTQRRDTPEDYLVASRSVGPWLTALSSAATNHSGFMFVGTIGFTYRGGLHTIWMAAMWILGDLLVWLWIHRRVRDLSGAHGVVSVPALLGTDRGGRIHRPIAAFAAVCTLVFLGGYAAAQLNAGATALTGLFEWPQWAGVGLGAAIVLAYCYAGGIRASIWTDAAQALVMFGSMAAVLIAAVATVGGPLALYSRLEALDPALVAWMPPDIGVAFPLYLLGFVAGGFGAIGQPHILVRSMAITSVAAMARARVVYFAWFVPFYASAVAVALYARVLLPDLATGQEGLAAVTATEGALMVLARELLPDVWVGVLLAGLFSATMSTADSQILSCSAAVTQDLAPQWRHSSTASKLATVAVTAGTLAVALGATRGVFALVLGSWSALGAALGPILVLRVFRWPVPTGVALVMMAAGLATALGWAASPLAPVVFELLPGLAVPFAIYLGWSVFGGRAAFTAR